MLQTGLALLEQFAAASRPQSAAPAGQSRIGLPTNRLETVRDEATGRSYLKLPVPDPETLDRTLAAVGTLLEQFRQRSV